MKSRCEALSSCLFISFILALAAGCKTGTPKTTPEKKDDDNPFVGPRGQGTGDAPGLAKGKSLFTQRSYTAALLEFDRYIKDHPEDSRGFYYRSICLQALQRPKEAIEALEKAVAREPNFPEKHNNLAGLLIKGKQLQSAVRVLEAAVKAFPRESSLWYNLGLARLFRGKFAAAASALDKAARGPAPEPKIFLAAGIAHLKDGQPKKALKRFERALTRGDANAGAHEGAAKCLLALGRPTEALKHAKKASSLSPGNAARLHLFGVALLACKQPEKAAKSFQRAAEKSPKSATIHLRWAEALAGAGKRQEALKKSTLALTLVGKKMRRLRGEILLARVRILASLKRCREAQKSLREAKSLVGEEEVFKEALKKALGGCGARNR